ncbi:hypothetical protein BDR04DRAFT_1139831 [Suillus decipiens]|nr:hypothetical protein BDR04DRAFT_1139831 [Suillus decipiens]
MSACMKSKDFALVTHSRHRTVNCALRLTLFTGHMSVLWDANVGHLEDFAKAWFHEKLLKMLNTGVRYFLLSLDGILYLDVQETSHTSADSNQFINALLDNMNLDELAITGYRVTLLYTFKVAELKYIIIVMLLHYLPMLVMHY